MPDLKKHASQIYDILERKYPEARIALEYRTPWQLLVATILSAQCTDQRVNAITKSLFKDYPDIEDYIRMSQENLIKYIKSAGFYRNKSKNILAAAGKITDEFGGRVPCNMEDMLNIPGVARKTANVVLGNAYDVYEGIAVDTHVKRLSFRLGLTENSNPVKIEKDLMELFPKKRWYSLTYLLIEHGRNICKAPAPECSGCFLSEKCPRKGVKKSR